MRVLWVCVGITLGAVMVEACGGGDTQDSTVSTDGGGSGGSAGARGGSGGTGNAGVGGAGGKSGSAGASGIGGTDGGGGAGGSGTEGGVDATEDGSGSDSGTDVAPSDGGAGEEGAAGSSSGGDGSADAPRDCGAASDDKRIFVSSALYTGNLGGLTGADSKCQGLANTAGLCGTFKAWLSDATGNAVDRLTHATGNYVLVSGQIVASGWSGLISGTLQHAIDLTEMNGAAPNGTVSCGGGPNVPVWTGSTVDGTTIVMNGSCDNWAGSGGGIFGNGDATNNAWTAMCQLLTVCSSTAALYCVEQ